MITENIKNITAELPEKVKLVAVSKTKPNSDILEAYKFGQRIFGENKVQDLCEKYESLPKDIDWHFIGHLQSNKVKFIAPFVNLIHAVDKEKLLMKINSEGLKNKRVIPCLLQIHIAEEQTKFGFDFEEIKKILSSDRYKELKNTEVHGLMGMATYTDNLQQVADEFAYIKKCFDELKSDFFSDKDYFKELSIGMSGDYKIAVENGSTMIRVGSSIFGSRN